MLLLPVVFLLIPIYTGYSEWQSSGNLVDHFNALRDWDHLPSAILSGLPFYVAGFIGYATHLHLDGILFRSRKSQTTEGSGKSMNTTTETLQEIFGNQTMQALGNFAKARGVPPLSRWWQRERSVTQTSNNRY